MDLLYWEQRCGNWASNLTAELDIACENLMVFNNRELLTTLLGVPESLRQTEYPRLFIELIRRMQPGLLSVPFRIGPAERLKRLLKLAGIHETVKGLYYWWLSVKNG